MNKVNAKLGTDYKLFNYYGAPDAERVIVAMGSVCDVAEEVIDYMNATRRKGRSCKGSSLQTFRGRLSSLRLSLPHVKKIAVLDRTKEPGSLGEPLYLDVVTALATMGMSKHQGCRRSLRSRLQGYSSAVDLRSIRKPRSRMIRRTASLSAS